MERLERLMQALGRIAGRIARKFARRKNPAPAPRATYGRAERRRAHRELWRLAGRARRAA
jgi:hypothetical protein